LDVVRPPRWSITRGITKRMSQATLILRTLCELPRDATLLFFTRFIRLFAYGAVSVILVFYLVRLGLTEAQVGLLLTLTLLGDIAISFFLTTRADRSGRKRTLIIGAALMAGAGLAFASTHNLLFLIVAGTVGVISPSRHEGGPFLSVGQAALSHLVSSENRKPVFAWYTLVGSIATALGALCGGAAVKIAQHASLSPKDSYRAVVIFYAALGVALAVLFTRLSVSTEIRHPSPEASINSFFGIGSSRSV